LANKESINISKFIII